MDRNTKDKVTKGQRDNRTKRQRYEGTKERWDKGMEIIILSTKGPRDKG